jgi:hypothetical protein
VLAAITEAALHVGGADSVDVLSEAAAMPKSGTLAHFERTEANLVGTEAVLGWHKPRAPSVVEGLGVLGEHPVTSLMTTAWYKSRSTPMSPPSRPGRIVWPACLHLLLSQRTWSDAVLYDGCSPKYPPRGQFRDCYCWAATGSHFGG